MRFFFYSQLNISSHSPRNAVAPCILSLNSFLFQIQTSPVIIECCSSEVGPCSPSSPQPVVVHRNNIYIYIYTYIFQLPHLISDKSVLSFKCSPVTSAASTIVIYSFLIQFFTPKPTHLLAHKSVLCSRCRPVSSAAWHILQEMVDSAVDDGFVARLQQSALRDGAVLRHLHSALFHADTLQQVCMCERVRVCSVYVCVCVDGCTYIYIYV